MTELFRYIEQSFVRPASKDNSISLDADSDFQNKIRRERNQPSAGEKIRKEAQDFIAAKFATSPRGSLRLGDQLLQLHKDVLNKDVLDLRSPYIASIDHLTEQIFHTNARELIHSATFKQDKETLSDSIIAVKLTTAFDKVNAAELVAMRQAVEFLTLRGEDQLKDGSYESIKRALLRPTHVSSGFFVPKAPFKLPETGPSQSEVIEQKRVESLKKETDELKQTYYALMAIPSDDLLLTSPKSITATAVTPVNAVRSRGEARDENVPAEAFRSVLVLSESGAAKLSNVVRTQIHKADVDLTTTPLSEMVDVVKGRWLVASRELEPYVLPQPVNVYQFGIHTFAVQSSKQAPAATVSLPDFSQAITRPVGIGNLQVVRQELIGYVAGEISHIENVLEGELFQRTTRRAESTDLTVTTETETVQSEERDLQSTERNEMATEASKEASKQSVATQGQTTTTDYGKLVENSKTNYARSVTDRAVNNLTQKVRTQRVQRERRSYAEKTNHEFDNTTGAGKIRGIYQWVDKKYKTRIINYGERLLYDVVLPEPAALLIDTLKAAQQPEGFQLQKPIEPWFVPQDLNATSYTALSKLYGVTGAVEPPPDEFVQTIAKVDSLEVTKDIKAFGLTIHGLYYGSFILKIPLGYQAIGGYVTRLIPLWAKFADRGGQDLNFYIGENYILSFGKQDIPFTGLDNLVNKSFKMKGETGELPVLLNSTMSIVQFNYAVGINCKRTDKAYERWQLKTFATITEGYRRQLALYDDKLEQRQAVVRAQMLLTQNFRRNPSVERTELKRMFIHLLIREHLSQVGLPTPVSDQFFFLTDPTYVKQWGAVVAFFERAFEWENVMHFYYPYFYGRLARWGDLLLIQDLDPQFEEFLKAGAARVVIPVRPGFEAALAHYHETGDIWMGEEMPDMFGDQYVSIIEEIKARNYEPADEVCVAEWDVRLPTTLVMLKDDATLPEWESTVKCGPPEE